MAGWMNSDGLYVKFGADEGDILKGGHFRLAANSHVCEFIIDYTDLLSATSTILGAATAATDGVFGVTMPKSAVIEEIETIADTAFTSSGTIGSSTLELGLKKSSDRSTELDHDGFLTTSFVGSSFDAAGEKAVIRIGSTGAGALIGTALSENGVITCRNSAHGAHPYTAGKLRVRIKYYYK